MGRVIETATICHFVSNYQIWPAGYLWRPMAFVLKISLNDPRLMLKSNKSFQKIALHRKQQKNLKMEQNVSKKICKSRQTVRAYLHGQQKDPEVIRSAGHAASVNMLAHLLQQRYTKQAKIGKIKKFQRKKYFRRFFPKHEGKSKTCWFDESVIRHLGHEPQKYKICKVALIIGLLNKCWCP